MREYEKISVEILVIENIDVISTSAPGDNGFNGDDDEKGWGMSF